MSQSALFEFAKLASTLGFDTSKIRSLNSLSPDFEIARQASPIAEPPQICKEYGKIGSQIAINQTTYSFLDPAHSVSDLRFGEFVTGNRNRTQSLRPWLNRVAYAGTAEWLTIDVMDQQPSTKGRKITELFLLRSVFKAFLYGPAVHHADDEVQITTVSHHSHCNDDVVPTILMNTEAPMIACWGRFGSDFAIEIVTSAWFDHYSK
ncbi:hypothetical protein CFIO01_11760 [Colletotrichum fioriniae PJ7]|uniref:Uncharacterized protein n=1 Tax=Colletotrichum fioriniae PJ7 TaxID=1445577 RepID=A0A010S1W9_9PEZI|nr:hypothetical protein CFIO01_11760 [Colletotrichum fioriniae PJ7]